MQRYENEYCEISFNNRIPRNIISMNISRFSLYKLITKSDIILFNDIYLFSYHIFATGIRCPTPIVPEFTELLNSWSLSGEYSYKSVITYRCMTGYELVQGDLSLKCGQTKEWIGEIPDCQSKKVSV